MARKARILIIDDEFIIHKLFINLLCTEYNLLFASNGKQGLEMLRKEKPPLLMLDYQLKDMTGDDFLSQLHPTDLLNTRVAMISGHATLDNLKQENRNKVAHLFPKPFLDLQTMLDTIARLVQNRR